MRRANVSRAEPRDIHAGLSTIEERLAAQGRTLEEVVRRLKAQRIETPSWGYANSGTRFKVFPQPGVPRSVEEKLADAAQVHQLTGVAPSVALHIPWDRVDDWAALRRYAEGLGLTLGAINPNLFQDEVYKLGSLAHPDAHVRRRAVDHVLDCIGIAQQTGSTALSLWLADGTNYAGQDDLRARFRRLLDGLQAVYDALPNGVRLLVEYKFFEPAFYSTDVPDWGTAAFACRALGAHRVLLDAFETDVRPLLARHREALGLEPDPLEAFRGGAYAEERARTRPAAAPSATTPASL